MKTRLFAFLCVLIILIAAAPFAVLAQSGGEESPSGESTTAAPAGAEVPIRKDTPLTVHLIGAEPVSLSYKTNGEEIISISARSLEADGVLDPILTVIDPTGVSIATNDDHRTSRTDLAPRDSLIADLNLSDSGRYLIQVESFDEAAEGDVEVVLTAGSGSSAPATEIPANPVISDRVPDNDAFGYDLEASEGDVVTITVRATDNQLDPKVSLVDSGGIEVASNDDHDVNDPSMGPYDSQIAGFSIPKSDSYTIVITGFAGIGGTFELTIEMGGTESPINPTPPPVNPTQPPEDTTQVIEGTVNPNDVYTYQMTAQEGEVYTITVVALDDALDPRVAIYFQDTYVTDNDDYGTTDSSLEPTDSRIYNLIIAESGTYEIDVRGYQDSSGDFRMTLERVATDAPTGLPTEQVEIGTLQAGDTYSVDFEAQAGDWVTITARALTQDFDPYVALLNADGTVLLDNDDQGSGSGFVAFYDAQITNYHITESGTYTVEVTGVSDVSGSFGLTISTLR